jgi:hypothetical protein
MPSQSGSCCRRLLPTTTWLSLSYRQARHQPARCGECFLKAPSTSVLAPCLAAAPATHEHPQTASQQRLQQCGECSTPKHLLPTTGLPLGCSHTWRTHTTGQPSRPAHAHHLCHVLPAAHKGRRQGTTGTQPPHPSTGPPALHTPSQAVQQLGALLPGPQWACSEMCTQKGRGAVAAW